MWHRAFDADRVTRSAAACCGQRRGTVFPRLPHVVERVRVFRSERGHVVGVVGAAFVIQAKLVRDRIPQIIRDRGQTPMTRVASDGEYRRLLEEKLQEEVAEFLGSGDPEELADIVEVVLALAGDCGVDRQHLEKLRASKAAERGAFSARIVWLVISLNTAILPL